MLPEGILFCSGPRTAIGPRCRMPRLIIHTLANPTPEPPTVMVNCLGACATVCCEGGKDMTDFFTMPGGVVNLQSEDGITNLGGTERSSMAYVQPPGKTKDDGGTVRFNTIDWERRAKVAADGVAGLEEALARIESVGKANHFGDLVEGREVHARLSALVESWRKILRQQVGDLTSLKEACMAAGTSLTDADSSTADGLRA